ncbi:MAG TPA: hypothetical protein VF165_07675 [Nocardioidaceae bacterium]
MTRTPKVGDVFLVPTGDSRAGVGQVIGAYGKHAKYLAIFSLVLPLDQAAARATEALTSGLLLLGLSLDAKFHAGYWTVVDHAPVHPDMPLPAYKEAVTTHDHIDVVDHSGLRRRRATRAEADLLPNRKVVAPVRLERALRVSLGLEPWLTAFDDLTPGSIVPSAAMFD